MTLATAAPAMTSALLAIAAFEVLFDAERGLKAEPGVSSENAA